MADKSKQRLLVLAMIAVTTGSVLGATILIFISWFHQSNLTAVIDVMGDVGCNGERVEVLNSSEKPIISGRLDAGDGYEVKFSLDPDAGPYVLRFTEADGVTHDQPLPALHKAQILQIRVASAVKPKSKSGL